MSYMAEVDLESLSEQIQALQRAITEQQGTLTTLQSQLAEAQRPKTGGETGTGTSSPQHHRTSRRHLLTTAGAAAAATTAAVVVSANGNIAHAASGNDLVLGASNDANAITSLTNTAGSSPAPLVVFDNSTATTSTSDGLDGYGAAGAIGVYGEADSNTGSGVLGFSDVGWGVVGITVGGADIAALGGGLIYQIPQSTVGAPTSGSFIPGVSIVDAAGELWICTVAGSPGGWARVAHVASGASGSAGGAITYVSKPIRLLDTRSGASDALNEPGAPYAGGSTHSITIAGVSFNSVTVPSAAVGAMGNLTVVNPTGSGYVALVPHGAGFTGTAILAYTAGQTVSNSFNVGLSSGELDIIIGGNTTDVILDVFAVVV
jgi:hypothetical protein